MKIITASLKIKRRLQLYGMLRLVCLLVAALLLLANLTHGQDKKLPADSLIPKKIVPDGTTGVVLEVGPEDYLTKRKPPNEFEGTYSTLRIGLGYILDGATYSQNAVFKQQMDSAGLVFNSKFETRDFRVMASGVSKIKRTLSWKLGFMYDGDKKVWLLRETGFTIGLPELFSHIFFGRTK